MSSLANDTVAILMATYNGERFIKEQLDSIEAQTYKAWELWVSDDGSKDSTLKIVDDFSARNPGKVHLLPEHVPTGSACRNFFHLMRSVPKAYGFYAFCDQDDYWYPSKIEKTLGALRGLRSSNTAPKLAFCDAKVVDAGRDVISESFFAYTGVDADNVALPQLLVQNPISGAEVVANRALVEAAAVGCMDDIDMHDQWIGLVAAAFGEIAHVDEPLFDYRQHGSNQVGAKKMSILTVGDKMKIAAESLQKKEVQAGRLAAEYADSLPAESLELCRTFSNIKKKPKPWRLRWCRENGVEMNGLMRNVGLALFI